ncbi:MAG TPA: hypothetical protein DHW15_03570 [Bacteroidetes bacterium]|jgi:hypothetical protein|nr:MAG: hypothetical protein ABR94_08865 [Sphingobacteriales bacterium BACL12 MAG-120802-bin5]HCK21254.1 hypothetical protein [Bacteroidota bacterium]
MFRLLPYICFSVCILSVGGCNNDFVVTAPYEEKTFVTALIDVGDTLHYVRIHKAFAEEGVSPFTLLTDPDNNYYREQELEVWVEHWNGDILQQTFPFTYILGDTVGLPKDSDGIFESSPNVLYRYQGTMPDVGILRLFVHRIERGDTLTASTIPVKSFNVLFPVPNQFGINLTDTGKITYACNYAENARIYDLVLRMHYNETDPGSGEVSSRYKDWVMFSNRLGNSTSGLGAVAFELRANTFYSFVRDAFKEEPFAVREFDRLTFQFYAGGVEMYLLYLNNVATLGFNELYATTLYSNIQGGYGIFSSRYLKEVDSVTLSVRSLDSLACGEGMSAFGFLPSPDNPSYPDCQ